ncbi:MAG: ROK family protein [Candidatus Magasanikbacteria bacterium]
MRLLFDIGGTHTRLALAKNNKEFCEPQVFDTPENFEENLELWEERISLLLQSNSGEITEAVGGVPGMVNEENKLIRSPNLPQWKGLNIEMRLQKFLEKPVTLKNDADMVGLGEAEFGPGQDEEIVVYLTISTGIGGTRIVSGEIDQFTLGFEPGHQLIGDIENEQPTEWEALASGSGLEEKYGKDPKDLGDEVYDKVTHYIAVGVHNTIVHWSPNMVILGGGIMLGDIDINQLEEKVEDIMYIFHELPEFRQAELGDVGGLYGALAYNN